MKVMRWLILVSSGITLSLAQAGGPDLAMHAQARWYTHRIGTGYFDQINAAGYFNVIIRPSKRRTQMMVNVASYSAEAIQVTVKHHTLYLRAPWYPLPGLPRRPLITMYVNSLQGLTVGGPTNVTATNCYAHRLNIHATGSGALKLYGKLDLDHIKQSGSNHIDVRWVKSGTLYINSTGKGNIHLAGVAQTVYARVADRAVLQAEYLRARYVQVQTKDQAHANVLPVVTLRAFASDLSNVYYYKYPRNITRNTSQFGNVLQMAWHD